MMDLFKFEYKKENHEIFIICSLNNDDNIIEEISNKISNM
mgnify:CR=1 FL=1